jgi:hypothetical protein
MTAAVHGQRCGGGSARSALRWWQPGRPRFDASTLRERRFSEGDEAAARRRRRGEGRRRAEGVVGYGAGAYLRRAGGRGNEESPRETTRRRGRGGAGRICRGG